MSPPGRAAAHPEGRADGPNGSSTDRNDSNGGARYDRGTEELVLGSMVVNPGVIDIVTDIIDESDFYVPQNAAAFTAIVELHASGEPFDYNAVAGLVDVLETDVVAGWVTGVDNSSAAGRHARTILELAVKRAAARIVLDLDHAASNGAGFPEALSSAAYHLLDQSSRLESSVRAVNVITLSGVEPERVRWLWERRIPFGKITTLEGDPDKGKTTLALDIIARTTTGAPMPGESDRREPRDGVLVVAEDDPADTLVPRLMAAGADLSRVHLIEGIREHKDLRPVVLPRDLHRIAEVVKATNAALVVIDPLSAHLDVKDANSEVDVRRALAPVKAMAAATKAAVLTIRHHRKSGGKAMHAGGGSIGISGAARSGLAVGVHPDDENRRVLASFKHNLSTEPPSLIYELVVDDVHECPRIKWGKEIGISADQLLALRDDALGQLSRDVLAEVNKHPKGIDAKGVTEALDLDDQKMVSTYLSRLYDAGRITRFRRGVYAPRGAVESVETVEIGSGDSTDSTQSTLDGGGDE